MISLLRNLILAAVRRLYYLWGWVRAASQGVQVQWGAKVSPNAHLKGVISLGQVEIGKDVHIGKGSYIGSGLIQAARIGCYCSIGPEVIIGPTEHRLDHWTTSPYEALAAGESVGVTDLVREAPIIEDGVWLGARVIVLRGVRIGKRVVVAAGAVVAKDIPEGAVWGGVPATCIRKLSRFVAEK
jgi:acetyltransferase-like isoleucine patch superfamily enzyme